jgi:two-component system cell cycle response regulator CtrA
MSADPLRDAYVARLETENDELRERVRQLESALADPTWHPPIEWGLTMSETKVMRALLSRPQVSKLGIMTALYGDRPDDDGGIEAKIVDVFIHKLRRKIAPFEITIETLWGVGYALAEADRRYLLDEHRAMLTPGDVHGRINGPARAGT